MINSHTALIRLVLCIPILYNLGTPTPPVPTSHSAQPSSPFVVYLPTFDHNGASTVPTPTPVPTIPPTPTPAGPGDWPQLGHDPQRTNATPTEVDPPYCYAWKWYGAPIASRLQPVVSNGRLFIGGLDGALYARDATSGSPLWRYSTGGPIRNSAGVTNNEVIFSSYDGFTYALKVQDGSLLWKTLTGSSATAPLIDDSQNKVYVASTNGNFSALDSNTGKLIWTYSSGAAILTSPALSQDGQSVFFGNEAVQAISVNSNNGTVQWNTKLQGQSLAERYPVVGGNSVSYRSQPLYFFHDLLKIYGDDILNLAGALNPDWSADWAIVRPKINNFLTTSPQFQTFFVLNPTNGASRGVAPVLYTTGNNSTPTPPVYANNQYYVAYRARHGIQTDGGATHVATQYDAELGSMNLSTMDITGLKGATKLSGQPQFRMTSDEGAMLTMSGSILLVDNWERLGGINVSNGNLIAIGIVSKDWPECNTQCSPGGSNPFFPMSGNSVDPAYPFPSPRTAEGHSKGGAVVANGMIYWRVIEAGLAGIAHSSGGACPPPKQWHDSLGMTTSFSSNIDHANLQAPADLSTYVTTDRSRPAANPSPALVSRLQSEVSAFLQAANGKHLLPYFLERGMSEPQVWPNTYWNSGGKTGLALIHYTAQGNVFWFDPGELLYTLAMAYPYLGSDLQGQVKSYMAGEMGRYPPLNDLPYHVQSSNWLADGSPRELYTVPFRTDINNWPPAAANLSTLYGLWLWSKNTNDFSYVKSHWVQAQSLYNAKKGSMRYYADLSGVIGYYRLATYLISNDPANGAAYQASANDAMATALTFMNTGTNFTAFVTTAKADFLDPREIATGWSAPVFYGLTPEVGAYLAEQLSNQSQNLVKSLESLNSAGVGLLWWYITRVGTHAEEGESDYLTPLTAWSHFLAHAYIVQDSQIKLGLWLDRPWSPGDLYSIQKIVATIQAK